MIPDAEAIAIAYLREHDAVAALTTRIATATPRTTAESWVRVTQLGPRPAGATDAEHLIAFHLQFDCYAGATGGSVEASLLTRTVRAALHEMPDVEHDGVVVTVVRFGSCPRVPDTEFDPARDRYALDAFLYMHPSAS